MDDTITAKEAIGDEVHSVSFLEVKQTLNSILRNGSDASSIIVIADKGKGGIFVLEPKDSNLSNKEITIALPFLKIVLVRYRIRVMKQRINSSSIWIIKKSRIVTLLHS